MNDFNIFTNYLINVYMIPSSSESSDYSFNKNEKIIFVSNKLDIETNCDVNYDNNIVLCNVSAADFDQNLNYGLLELNTILKIGNQTFEKKLSNVDLSETVNVSIPYTQESSKAKIYISLNQCVNNDCVKTDKYENVQLVLNNPIEIEKLNVYGNLTISTQQELPQFKIIYSQENKDRVGLREFYINVDNTNFEKIKSSYKSDYLVLDKDKYKGNKEIKVKAIVYHKLDVNKKTESEISTINIKILESFDNVLNIRCSFKENYIKCNLDEITNLDLDNDLNEVLDKNYYFWELYDESNRLVKKSNRNYIGFEPDFVDYTITCQLRTDCGRNINGMINLKSDEFRFKILGEINFDKINPIIKVNEFEQSVNVEISGLSIKKLNEMQYTYQISMGDGKIYTDTSKLNHIYDEIGIYPIKISINREDNKNYIFEKSIEIKSYEDIINYYVPNILDFRLKMNPPYKASVFRFIDTSARKDIYNMFKYIDYQIFIPEMYVNNNNHNKLNFKRYNFEIKKIDETVNINNMYYNIEFFKKDSDEVIVNKQYYFSERFQEYTLDNADIYIYDYSGKLRDYSNIDIKSFIKIRPKKINKYISGVQWQISNDQEEWNVVAGDKFNIQKSIEYKCNLKNNIYLRAKVFCLYNDFEKYSNTIQYFVDESLNNIVSFLKYDEYIQYGKKISVVKSEIPSQFMIGEKINEYNWFINDKDGNEIRKKSGTSKRDETYIFELSKTGNYTVILNAITNFKREINGLLDFGINIIEGSNPDFNDEFDLSQVKLDCKILSHTKKKVMICIKNLMYLKSYNYNCKIDTGNGEILNNISRSKNEYTYNDRGEYTIDLKIYDKDNILIGNKNQTISIMSIQDLIDLYVQKGLIDFKTKIINPYKKLIRISFDIPYYIQNEIEWDIDITGNPILPNITHFENSKKEYVYIPVQGTGEYKFNCLIKNDGNEITTLINKIEISENMPLNDLFEFKYYLYKSRKGYGYCRMYLEPIDKKELYGYNWSLTLYDNNNILNSWENKIKRMTYKFDFPGIYIAKLNVYDETNNVLYENDYQIEVINNPPKITDIEQKPFIYRRKTYNKIKFTVEDSEGKVKYHIMDVCGKKYTRGYKKTFYIPEDCTTGYIMISDDMGASDEIQFSLDKNYE